MSFISTFLFAGLITLALMTAMWLLSLALSDASIVDIFWGTGFVILNAFYFVMTPDGLMVRKWVLSALVTIWGLRLSIYILYRNWGKGEDFRYQRWREAAQGQWWWRSFFKVFLLQGFLLWIISTPLLAAQFTSQTETLIWLDAIAIALWAIGFFFEAVGDFQLARFKANPDNGGKLLTSGLWRYTRHPNYFGDATQWWGFYAFSAAAGSYWTIFSPILMTFLLLRVSGVSMLEKDLKETKPGYESYVRATSPFIPWFPNQN
jgi:steroid 5-alpha reductase family enzyme